MIIKIKYGLYYKERLFVWIDEELWRYPYTKGNRSYSLRKIKTTDEKGNKRYYRLGKDWVSQDRVEALTTIVNVEPINKIKDDDLPFSS
jgi:hypothetical protein